MNINRAIMIASAIAIGLILLFVSADAQNPGQTRTFEWSEIVCDFKGTYDPGKYTEAQLRDTYTLFSQDGPRLEISPTVWRYDEIAELDVVALDRSYNAARTEIENLNVIDTPFWRQVKKERLDALEQNYRLYRTTMIAYTKPAVIAEYPSAEACKAKYARPLAQGGEELVKAWREVNLESQRNNADPARLQRLFDEQNRSSDRLKFALVETMAFGWWNCANAEMRDGPAFARNETELHEEFRKLFIKVTEDCEIP